LPGGDLPDFAAFLAQARRDWPFLDAFTAKRMAQAYGTRIGLVLGDARAPEDLGPDFGLGLTAREVDYLVANEWAVTAEDVLWRRTKLGLRFTTEQVTGLHAYLGGD
jgi:glycerol-3-phosphate dehydrogenase